MMTFEEVKAKYPVGKITATECVHEKSHYYNPEYLRLIFRTFENVRVIDFETVEYDAIYEKYIYLVNGYFYNETNGWFPILEPYDEIIDMPQEMIDFVEHIDEQPQELREQYYALKEKQSAYY